MTGATERELGVKALSPVESKYVLRLVKDENRLYLDYPLRSTDEIEASGFVTMEPEDMVKMRSDIKAVRLAKPTAPISVAPPLVSHPVALS